MADQIKIGDYIEVLIDNPHNYKEIIGAKLQIVKVFGGVFRVQGTSHYVWSFTNEDFNRGYIKHIPTNLPSGINPVAMASGKNDNWEALMGIYNSGDWTYGNWETEITKTKPKIVCECGQSKIAGHEGDPWDQHSTYCPIYKEGKINAKK